MNTLYISQSKVGGIRPEISLDPKTGKCWIIGESVLESYTELFSKITRWLTNYMKNIQRGLEFNFHLSYYNSSTQRGILSILDLLKDYQESGKEVTINWYYDDEDALLEAEEFGFYANIEITPLPARK